MCSTMKSATTHEVSKVPRISLFLLLAGFWRLSAAVFIENFSHGRILPVVCYLERGQASRPTPMNYDVEDVPGDLCSHVNLAYLELDNSTWAIKLDSTVRLANFAQLKRKFPRLKTLLSIGGWSDQTQVISAMASTQTRRRAFINNTVQLLVDGDIDGLDVFWLFPGHVGRGGNRSDKINFVWLLKELYSAFKEHNLLLTAAVPLNQRILDVGYNIPAIDRYLDWMNVIGYDLRGVWNDRTDIHSPLHRRVIEGSDELNVDQGLQALLDRGASKRKLVLGVAFYGRVYKLASAYNTGHHAPIDRLNKPQSGPFLLRDDMQAYFEVCANVVFGQWQRGFDEEGMCPYATNGQDWVGYEDPESIARKVEFVRKEGYAGIMVQSCDKDDFRGVCGRKNALLETINNGIPRLRNNLVL